MTVISGLHTYGEQKLNALANEFKAKFGTGGTVKNGCIEIQGDKVGDMQSWFHLK